MRVRPLLVTVHRWVGLVAAVFLAGLGVTGAIIVFEIPLDDALNARLHLVEPRGTWLPVPELVRRLEAAHPGYRVTVASFGQDDRHADAVSLAADGRPGLDLFVNPYDASILGSVGESRNWLVPIHQFHTHLLARGPWGRTVVAWSAVALAFLALFGLILWWPAKIFWIRRGAAGWRVMFDLHNALGGLSWIFLLLFALTGMTLHWSSNAMTWATRLTGVTAPAGFPRSAPQCAATPAPAPLPLDRIYDAAAAAVPGARVTTVMLPDDVKMPARVIMKFPEDQTPAGRTNVFVASCTGTVIEARSSRAAPAAYQAITMWTREIHTGDIGGWPTRLLASAASLFGVAMAVTGPLMWWGKRKERVSP